MAAASLSPKPTYFPSPSALPLSRRDIRDLAAALFPRAFKLIRAAPPATGHSSPSTRCSLVLPSVLDRVIVGREQRTFFLVSSSMPDILSGV